MQTEALPGLVGLSRKRAFEGHWRDDAGRRTDAAVHLAGGAAALVAAPALLVAAGGGSSPLLAYALALTLLFPASGLFQHGPAAWRDVAIKVDHAAIYLKVAATFGALAAVSGAAVGPAVAGVWLLAGAGAVLRTLGPARMQRTSLALYLVVLLGGLAATWPALQALSPEARRLVMLGAAAYLAGMPFHLTNRFRFNQAIWHAAVLVASGVIYGAILTQIGSAA